MRVLLWQGCQKLRKTINVHTRHATVHGTQQRMIKVGYIYSLVDHKMETVPLTGSSFHIVIHQAIYIPTLDQHLLCPMQCRMEGLDINDCPKFLTNLPQENSYCIITKYEYDARNVLPLALKGVTSVFVILKITEA